MKGYISYKLQHVQLLLCCFNPCGLQGPAHLRLPCSPSAWTQSPSSQQEDTTCI